MPTYIGGPAWPALDAALDQLDFPPGRSEGGGQGAAALAKLCVLHGRLAEAERLIGDRRDHPDALLPLACLHLARGEYEEAIGVAGIGVRQMGADRVRAARLLSIVVQAQLALGTAAAPPRRPHDWPNWLTIAPSRYSARAPRWPAVLWHSITTRAPRPGTRSSWRCAY